VNRHRVEESNKPTAANGKAPTKGGFLQLRVVQQHGENQPLAQIAEFLRRHIKGAP